jgi:hypothetical protein
VRTEKRLSRCVEVMLLHNPPVDLDHHQLGEEEGVGRWQCVFARVRVALCCGIFLLKCINSLTCVMRFRGAVKISPSTETPRIITLTTHYT